METSVRVAIAAEAAKGIEAYDQGDRTQARISLEAILIWTQRAARKPAAR